MKSRYISRLWSEIPCPGETRVPSPIDSGAPSWPLFFLKREAGGNFTDGEGKPLALAVRHPDSIDFEGEQLEMVKQFLSCLTKQQICIAEYWNSGPPTKQWTPVTDRLIDTYGLTPARAARVLAAVQGGMNDAGVVTWYLKYHYNIPRPNQLCQELETIVCTPHHPSYPAGHAVLSGCAEIILGYFFGPEYPNIRKLAEECGASRVYAGVHFPADIHEGLRLGRQIGKVITGILDKQRDSLGCKVDHPITEMRNAVLMPPPYVQVIPFERKRNCKSPLDPRQCPDAR